MKIDHHRGPITAVKMSTASNVLVSSSTDGTISMWSLETYELLNTMILNAPVLNFQISADSVSSNFLATNQFTNFPPENCV